MNNMIKTFEDFVNENQNIYENIDFEQLNESFTNKELKDAIKAHGGLTKSGSYSHEDARFYGEFDLKNAKYVGYLKSETIYDIIYNNCYILLYNSLNLLLKTNDGGIIVIEHGGELLDKDYTEWLKKVKTRDNNWIDDKISEDPENNRYWNVAKKNVEINEKPDKSATRMRRHKHRK